MQILSIYDSSNNALIPEWCYYIALQEPYLSGSNTPANKKSEQYLEWMIHSTKLYASVEKKFMLYLARRFNSVIVEYGTLMEAAHQGGGKPLHVKMTMHGVYVIHHVVIY
jgi:hypothetical protein